MRDLQAVRRPPFPYQSWTPEAVLKALVMAGFDKSREIIKGDGRQHGPYFQQEVIDGLPELSSQDE